jgi:hypothetical protein
VTDGPRIPRDVQQVVDRMSDRDWDSLSVQLGRYALHRSRRFYWRTGRTGELPAGEVTESLVSKAYLLWLTGRRRWHPGEYDGLQKFLEGVIDSLLSHSANGFDNRRFASDDEAQGVAPATPETDLLERERLARADETLAVVVRQAQADPVALAVVAAMRNGAATRRDIARATGQPAIAVDNALKRLQRIAANVARGKEHRS